MNSIETHYLIDVEIVYGEGLSICKDHRKTDHKSYHHERVFNVCYSFHYDIHKN